VSKYLKSGMHLVYLDQCFVSHFLGEPENQQWLELRNLVLKGNAARKILCPTSVEHLFETSMLPAADAIFLDELMRKLSFGWTLSTDLVLITKQIIWKLRNRPVSHEQFLEKGVLLPVEASGALMELKQMKTEMDAHNAWLMQGVNELNALVRNGRKAGRQMLQFMIKRRTAGYAKELLAEVSSSLLVGRVVVRASAHNDRVPNLPSTVVYQLIAKHRLALAESHRLCRLLRTEGLSFIPTLRIKAELEAMQFFRREKIEPGDQYDITRAACALPYADIFITDGGKASAIRELKLDSAFGTEVFSTKKSELQALTTRLNEIVN
jgi:hypothetical protein